MNVGVLIGRFQFFHTGHKELIEYALTHVDHLIIALGSHAIAPTSRNPFSTAERAEHIKTVFPSANISFVMIHDHPESNEDWVEEIYFKVNQQHLESAKYTLFGHKKEDTEWYMNLFEAKGWEIHDFETDNVYTATRIRHEAYFGNDSAETKGWKAYVPSELHNHFDLWLDSDAGRARSDEYDYEDTYKSKYEELEYPPIFHAVDSIITCQGHVLLVKRGSLRGRGLYAMPGGYLDSRERLLDGAIREVYEETNLNVNPAVLKSCWTRDTLTLDNPNRSLLGRVVSEAFYFALPYDVCGGTLPEVSGGDDAKEALWMPLEKLKGNYYENMDSLRVQFFEDHLWAIKTMLSNIEAVRYVGN